MRRRLSAAPALLLLCSPLLAATSHSASSAAPVFRQYHLPAAMPYANSAAEPTIGFNPKTGNVLYMSQYATYRVSGFNLSRDEAATWTDVTDPFTKADSADPILHRDNATGRTFVNQKLYGGRSVQVYTDDDGATYTPSVIGHSVGISFDHQSVATGRPVPDGRTYPAPSGYPNYVYYCTNDLAVATCSVSIDGGRTYLAAKPVYNDVLAGGPCKAQFGHVQTDPRDGTVYLAPDGCDGRSKLFVSRDNTFTWTGYDVPGSTYGDAGHPAVAVGRQDGAVYYAWGSADGSPVDGGLDLHTGRTHVAVSLDKGRSWTRPRALGADLGVVTSRFPVVAAGDRGRAAVAFLGAKQPGDPNVSAYTGVWHLYISYTADGGRTWRTYDATPRDPVQIGPVTTWGLEKLSRNLLDFNDIDLDGAGRVVVAFGDGSPTGHETHASGLARATIVRQANGPSLYGR
jgi:hypothetical protein